MQRSFQVKFRQNRENRRGGGAGFRYVLVGGLSTIAKISDATVRTNKVIKTKPDETTSPKEGITTFECEPKTRINVRTNKTSPRKTVRAAKK